MNRYRGLSLLEMLLVFVIGMAIFVMGLRLYYSFKTDTDVMQVQANVDHLFEAMSDYYRAQCYGTVNANQVEVPGTLNPGSAPPVNKSISIPNDLVKPGFFNLSSLVMSPIVNAAGSGTNGYVTQFNKKTLNRNICTKGAGAFGSTSPNCATKVSVGQVTSWQAQVAVQMNKPARAQQFLGWLGGDCLSNLAGNIVTPCRVGGVPNGTFVVFERPISFAVQRKGSTYWLSTPTVTQFKQMYTTSPVNSLTNGTQTANQHYLCGN